MPSRPRKRAARVLVLALVILVVLASLATAIGYWMWTSPPDIDPGSVETTVIGAAVATERGDS